MAGSELYRFGGWQAVIFGLVCFVAAGIIATVLVKRPIVRALGTEGQHRISGSIFLNMVRLLVWGTVVSLILDQCFGVSAAGIVSALGIVGIAVSLGAQQTLANVIGGLIISLSRTIAPGDWIALPGVCEAKVVDTDWRSTVLKDEDGVRYVVPNSEMVSNTVSLLNSFYAVVVPFSLKSEVEDLDGLLRACEQVVLEAQVASDVDVYGRRPQAYVVGAAAGSVQAELQMYVSRTSDKKRALRCATVALVGFLQERAVLAQRDGDAQGQYR